MKRFFVPFLAISLAFPAAANNNDTITGDQLTGVQLAIALHGFKCEKINEARFMGRTNRGALIVKAICNDFEFVYRVEVPEKETDPWLIKNYFD